MSKPNLSKPSNDSGPDGDDEFELEGLDEIDSKFLVPDGDYKFKLIEIEKDTSNSGNPMWVWDFTIVEGPEAGKEFRLWTVTTASAMWKMVQVLVALGLHDGESASVKFKRSDAIGRMCMGTMEQQTYQGRMSSKIKEVFPLED